MINFKMKNIFFLIMTFSIFNFGFFSKNSFAKTTAPKSLADNIYGFEFIGFDGSKVKLSEFKNKVLLIVNTASKCGFTSHYGDLEKLHQKYKDQGLVIIGVPSNDFGGQEPLNNSEIQNFCKYNYGVNFLVTQKEVVTGKDAHQFYVYAKEKLGTISAPKWNFHKYLINKKGEIIDFYISSTNPLNEKITTTIETELKK